MIIFSEDTDQTTNEVIDWLLYYNKKHLRVNPEDVISERLYIELSCDKEKTIIRDTLLPPLPPDCIWWCV